MKNIYITIHCVLQLLIKGGRNAHIKQYPGAFNHSGILRNYSVSEADRYCCFLFSIISHITSMISDAVMIAAVRTAPPKMPENSAASVPVTDITL